MIRIPISLTYTTSHPNIQTWRHFAAICIFFSVSELAMAQPRVVEHPPAEITVNAGTRTAWEAIYDQAMKNPQGYIGESGDTSMPVAGALTQSDEITLQFTTPFLFETTTYWMRACTDFGCADTTSTKVIVLSEDTGPPAPFEDAAELGGNWYFSDWLGSINLEFEPWIFHSEHEWMFNAEGNTPESVFLFDLSANGWIWTNATSYPNTYSFPRNSWIFYFAGTSNPREFVDLVSGDFFQVQ